MGLRFKLWLIILLTMTVIFIDLPFIGNLPTYTFKNLHIDPNQYIGKIPFKFGLDLQGGTQLVLETDMSKINEADRDQALESAKDVIERRVNLYGVSESLVQGSRVGGSRRILVELPGITDASAAAELVGKTAQLEFRELPPIQPEDATGTAVIQTNEMVSTGLTGADLKKAQVVFGSGSAGDAGPQVQIEFNAEGTKKFGEITKRNFQKPLAIYRDEEMITAPIVQQEIITGTAVISGNFDTKSAKELEVQLNAGALPVPIKIIDQRSVGATLGSESVAKSVVAGVIGLTIIMLYMVFYYGLLGFVADMALIIYALIVLAIFKTGLFILPPITLTLAGIAGFILSIGMAVDANILIFERIKEEKRWGKSTSTSLELGFRRAWTSIRDSNISSLITAGILYFMGTGPVKGFAITLAIGVAVSMFTAITVTRTFLKLIIK